MCLALTTTELYLFLGLTKPERGTINDLLITPPRSSCPAVPKECDQRLYHTANIYLSICICFQKSSGKQF